MIRYFILVLLFSLLSSELVSQPVVIGHPRDSSICVEASAAFRVLALNTAAYQWQENDGVGWYNINSSITYAEGYLSPELRINDANLGLNGYQYRCQVFDAQNNQAFSDPATLGVYDPPIITQQPVDQRVCKNNIAKFSVVALNGTLFQWQESVGEGWVELNDNAFYSGTNSDTLSIFTTTGMNGFRYRCIVTHVSCPEITLAAQLFVDATPVIHNVSGGGSFCQGGSGVAIGLTGSETGISYQLLRNGLSTGIVLPGTGQSLDFGLFTQAGDYTILGINGFTGCQISMDGVATISIDPLPQQQNLLGGGAYCIGNEEPELYLSGTQAGVAYSLLRNGQSTGISITGNGFPASFGQTGQPGTYQVLATNSFTGCQLLLNNSREIVANLPPLAFAGSDQTLVSGSTVQLTGSASGGSGTYQFHWYPESYCLNPLQSNTTTIPLYVSRLFSITATDQATGCESPADSVLIRITDGPLNAYIQASEDRTCPGGQLSLSAVVSGGAGNYTFEWTSLPQGFFAATENTIVTPETTTNYILKVQDGLSTVYDTVSIQVLDLPVAFNLSPGGHICSGSAGIELSLSGSETGVVYSLYRDDQFLVQRSGTGTNLIFGTYTLPGAYRVTARYNDANCVVQMTGISTIGINPNPVAEAGNNQIITAGGQTSLNGSGSGGSGSYSYQWSPAAHLLNPLFQNPVTTTLNETIVFSLMITDNQTGCQSTADQVAVFVSGGNLSLNVVADRYNVCPNEGASLVAMPTGGSGSFVYLWQSNPPGFVSTQFNPIVYPQQTTTYRVMVSDGFNMIQDSVQIVVRQAPSLQTVSGGGTFCPGEEGREVYLTQSQTDVMYGLYRNGNLTGTQLTGNGTVLNFGNQNIPGFYTVDALHLNSGCGLQMIGNVLIQQAQPPSVQAGVDRTIDFGTSTFLSGTVVGGSGVNSYLWTPAQWVNQPFALQTSTKALANTTIFSFGATDQQSGCVSQADSLTVYVSGGSLSVQANASQESGCEGSAIQLFAVATGGTGNYLYQWTSIPSGFYSNMEHPVVNPLMTTSYVLIVSDGLMQSSDTVHIVLSQPPQIFNLTGGGALCNPSQSLQIGLSGSEAGVLYQLELNGLIVATISGNGSAVQFGLMGQPGVYMASARYFNSICESQMAGQAVITIDAASVALAGPDKLVPAGGQVTLSGSVEGGSGLYSYQWSPPNLLLNPDALQPTTKPLYNTTVFRLDVQDLQSGCPGTSDYVAVFVQGGNLNLEVISSGGGACSGSPVQMFALPTGGSGNYTYAWVSSPPGFSSQEFDPVFFPEVSTTFIVVVNDGNQLVYDSVYIPVQAGPQQYFLSGSGGFCNGNEVNLQLSGSQQGIQYSLFRDNAFSGISVVGNGFPLTFGPLEQSGLYSVKAFNPATGCNNLMEGQATITINPLPVADAGPDRFISSGETAQFNGQAFGGSGQYTYQWFPVNLLQNPVSPSPTTISLSSTRLFLLQVRDETSGCLSLADTSVAYVSNGALAVTVIASSDRLCQGEGVNLQALPQGGNGEYTITWKNAEGQTLFIGLNWIDYPMASTTYYITVTDGAESVSDSIAVEVGVIPAVFSITGGGSYCEPLSAGVLIGLSGSEEGVVYELFLNNSQKLTSVVGQGAPLQFGYFTIEGNYSVRAHIPEYNCEALMAGNAIVIQENKPIVSAGPDIVINQGNEASLSMQVLSGSGSFSYSWSPANLVYNPQNPFTQTLPLQFSLMFKAEVTDLVTGCSATDDVMVITSGGPMSSVIEASAQLVCPGELVTLTALPLGGAGNYNWEWLSEPEGFYATSATIKVYPSVNTWYKVSISDNEQVVNDSVFVEVYGIPDGFQLTGGGVLCFGDPAPTVGLESSQTSVLYELFRNGNFTGQWQQGTGGALSFGAQAASGSYSVIARSQTGCINIMPGQVSVGWEQPPNMYSLLGGGSFCDQDPEAGLYLTGSEINTLYQLFLNDAAVNQSVPGTGGPLEFANPGMTGSYTVEAQRAFTSCASMMAGTANLIVFPVPVAAIEGPTFMCTGEEIKLTGSGGDEYEWLTNPPLFTKEIIVNPEVTTTYTLIVRNSFGCSSQKEHLVDVGETPIISIEVSEQLLQVIVTPSGLDLYEFRLAEEILQSGTSNTFYYGNLRPDGDTLFVTATSSSGCESEVGHLLLLRTGSEANAFTPNGDNINDRFLVGEFIRVFSRWGKEIYSGSDGWDGKYEGTLVAPGTYYYLHEIKDKNGSIIRIVKGSVTMVIE
jgi:gliding motility-associated-like protein